MRVRLALRVACSVLALGALAGCAYFDSSKVLPSVDDAALDYNNHVRWGRYEEASASLSPLRRREFLELFQDEARPWRFTSVELGKRTPQNEAGTEVEYLVDIEYYRLPSVKERKVQQRQIWHWVASERRWECEPDLHVFPAQVGSGVRLKDVPAALDGGSFE
jgi:hypothetical protein